MGYLLNVSLSCESSVGGAGEEEYSSCSGLGEEIFGGGFYGPGVVVLGYEGKDSKGVNFKAYSGQ